MALSVETGPVTLGRRTAEQRLVKEDVKSRICRGGQRQSGQAAAQPGLFRTEGGCAHSPVTERP